MELKNKAFRKYVRCNNSEQRIKFHNVYKVLKNELVKMTRASKKKFYEEYFTRNKDNLKKVWKGIKEIVNIKTKTFDQPTNIQKGDETLSDPKAIANEFNSYFTSIADDILSKRKYEGVSHIGII